MKSHPVYLFFETFNDKMFGMEGEKWRKRIKGDGNGHVKGEQEME